MEVGDELLTLVTSVPKKKKLLHQMDKKLGLPHSRCGCGGEEKNPSLFWGSNRGCAAPRKSLDSFIWDNGFIL
jgi:hypothetical protein